MPLESVWDYPRPPRLEAFKQPVRVEIFAEVAVHCVGGLRVLETSHPPVYYLPLQAVTPGLLRPSLKRPTFCEFKGLAHYWDAVSGSQTRETVAWSYPEPTAGFEALRGFVAFYAGRVDACFLDGERVTPQPGDYYGGWITRGVVGPFKGG